MPEIVNTTSNTLTHTSTHTAECLRSVNLPLVLSSLLYTCGNVPGSSWRQMLHVVCGACFAFHTERVGGEQLSWTPAAFRPYGRTYGRFKQLYANLCKLFLPIPFCLPLILSHINCTVFSPLGFIVHFFIALANGNSIKVTNCPNF